MQSVSMKSNANSIGFGAAIPIKKVLIDGIETADIKEIAQAARGLGDILIKQEKHPNGKSIRRRMAKMTGDYKTPKSPVNNSQNPTVEMNIRENKQYFATGKEAVALYDIGYAAWFINHGIADGRIPSKELKHLELLKKEAEKVVNDPEAQSKKGLILQATRVPAHPLLKECFGTKDEIKLTNIDFTA